jgi:hypothetical protein
MVMAMAKMALALILPCWLLFSEQQAHNGSLIQSSCGV